MELIEFKNGETSVSAEVFLAFQDNIKKALVNYKEGELQINNSYFLENVSLTKDENNTVNLSFSWEPPSDIKTNQDYIVGYLPQEFRPHVPYIYGGARGEYPYCSPTFVIARDDGRVILNTPQKCALLAMSCSFKASGGEAE